MSELGAGVAAWEGRTVFIDRTAPGDRVRARVFREGKVWRGELLELVSPSSDRQQAPCALNDRCGGCDWMHLRPEAQLRAKEEIVLSALEHLGGIPRGTFALKPISGGAPEGTRRRAVLHFSRQQLVFFAPKSHKPVPVERCIALSPPLVDLPGRLSPLLAPISRDVDEVHLLAEGLETAFALVLKDSVRERHLKAAHRAIEALGFRGAVLTPPQGRETVVAKPTLRARCGAGAPRYLRPDAFSQAHAELNEAVVTSGVDGLAVSPGSRVLELFSGNGNFTFAIAAAGAAEVIAVESTRVSLELARQSARAADVTNARFVLGDAETVARGLVGERARFDRLLLDPPRAGFPSCGELARALGVERVVYVSCNPSSLARDAAGLVSAGYTPESVQPFDLFPQTHHMETVMAFSRERDR